MFGQSKYETGIRYFNGTTLHKNETTANNFVKNHADLRYHVGGSGRDTYIFNDNGGFGAMYRPRDQERPGGFLPVVNKSPSAAKRFSNVNQIARTIRYKTDGTGRDTYCVNGDGGFTNPVRVVAMDPRQVFQRSLRGYQQDDNYAERRQRRVLRKAHKRTVS